MSHQLSTSFAQEAILVLADAQDSAVSMDKSLCTTAAPQPRLQGREIMATPHALVWKSWFIMGEPYIPLVCICKLSAGKQILVNDKIQKRFIL